jgi:hypothetical protein
VISLIAFGLAVALLIAHILDGRVPRGYVLAAFTASALVAAGDVREYAGQTCTTTTTTAATTTTNASAAVAQTYPVETCKVYSTVNVGAVAALTASIAMALLVLAYEVLDRLGRAAGGWTV